MSSMPNGSTASHGKSLALAFLNEVIDGNRLPRKALADEIGKSEQTFSKMTAGSQAFGIDDFGALPRDVQIAWMKRYGQVIGLDVRDVSAVELAEEIVTLFSAFREVVDLAARLEAIKPRMANVGLPERESARKAG